MRCQKLHTWARSGPFAHYQITSKLGEGGMGEVWRATDTKLNRDVAIKIWPDSLAEDAGGMARFQREAQVLACLNHPNIAVIHGVEERALILKLVEATRWQNESPPVPFRSMKSCRSRSKLPKPWSTRMSAA